MMQNSLLVIWSSKVLLIVSFATFVITTFVSIAWDIHQNKLSDWAYLFTGLGALNLSSPIGGSAKGIPHHMSTSLPVAEVCRMPCTGPSFVCTVRSGPISARAADRPDGHWCRNTPISKQSSHLAEYRARGQ